MPKKLTIRMTLTDAEVALFRQYAAEHYRPELGIDWKCVAEARATQGVKDAIVQMQERQAKQSP